MKSFAFLIALLALFQSSSAFTTVQPRTVAPKSQAVAPLNMFVDMTGGDIASVPPVASIFSLFGFVTLWELFDPDRANFKMGPKSAAPAPAPAPAVVEEEEPAAEE